MMKCLLEVGWRGYLKNTSRSGQYGYEQIAEKNYFDKDSVRLWYFLRLMITNFISWEDFYKLS